MENYIVNNNVIAIIKKNKQTIMYCVDKVIVFNINITKFLNFSCIYYGSNLKGRKISAQNILNIKYKIPIIIDENNFLTLIPLNSPRMKKCIYLSTNKIINYEEHDKYLIINCINNIRFCVKISKYNFEKILMKALLLNNTLFWRKNAKFL